MMAEEIIQKQNTLNQVFTNAVKEDENGCNFRIVQKASKEIHLRKYFLERGCSDIRTTSEGRELDLWIGSATMKEIPHSLRHSVVNIISRMPCRFCGGTKFFDTLPIKVIDAATL